MNVEKQTGSVRKALSGFYYVDCEGELITCRARGKFRHQKRTPLVGDLVEISKQQDGSGSLDEILPRKNEFLRPAIANIDQMVIIASASNPITDPFLIDQMCSLIEDRNCEILICLNKWDLAPAQELYDCYTAAGFPVLRLSAHTGQGLEELRAALVGKISAFTGNSGVGKSSLLNALRPGFCIPVGEVSDKLGRGRHTTRHIELYPLVGGFIADTPGFSAFDPEKMEPRPAEELGSSFREFVPYLDDCHFVGCAHVRDLGCAVLEAKEAGKISESRHESYVRLYLQAKERKSWK